MEHLARVVLEARLLLRGLRQTVPPWRSGLLRPAELVRAAVQGQLPVLWPGQLPDPEVGADRRRRLRGGNPHEYLGSGLHWSDNLRNIRLDRIPRCTPTRLSRMWRRSRSGSASCARPPRSATRAARPSGSASASSSPTCRTSSRRSLARWSPRRRTSTCLPTQTCAHQPSRLPAPALTSGSLTVHHRLPDDRVALQRAGARLGQARQPGEHTEPAARLLLGEPPRYRCHLGCILLKMAAISLSAGQQADPSCTEPVDPNEEVR